MKLMFVLISLIHKVLLTNVRIKYFVKSSLHGPLCLNHGRGLVIDFHPYVSAFASGTASETGSGTVSMTGSVTGSVTGAVSSFETASGLVSSVLGISLIVMLLSSEIF